MNDGKDNDMCKYYHPELGGSCFAQKGSPSVRCRGWKCNCELSDNDITKDSNRYLIKKLEKSGMITISEDIIKGDELVFRLANIAFDLAFGDAVSVLIVKSSVDGRANDGKDSND